MITELQAPRDSFLHRIDPRLRIVAAAFFSCAVAVFHSFTALMAACVPALALLLLSGLDIREIGKRLAVVLGFLLMLWLLLPLTYEGEAVGKLGPLNFYWPGIVLSAHITLKSMAIIAVFTALVATIPVTTLGQALGRLRVPAKLVYLLLMCYRYIFVIEQEYRRLSTAMKIRGFNPRTSLHTYRSYAYLVGILFVRAAARADRVYQAMRCRGFNGRFHSLARFPAHPVNRWFALTAASAMIVLLGLEWIC
ncbi:MAG: cobalt ECF transporter T component CbiQ [Desulfosarcina sp.]|nr:cobalt ECF transporter T component CbiQ [Desulfobacterales bacterium]